MTIDQIIEETTISFKEDLDLEIVEDLLKHVSETLPANISYHAGYFRNFRYEEIVGASMNNGTVDIVGRIAKTKEPYLFNCYTPQLYCDWVVDFSRVPEGDISDYRPEVRQLWKDVREIVEDYYDTMSKLMKELKETTDRISQVRESR
ncbi:hypothetical protein COU57_06530 [Candidatus Pacearchaeota archaeon CG10_big_fil_rev_8_21_14_0_10_32_14]|nr:MAG: hypothetical protein COU57_06530 [Candidatus Pacearchaeota archaeon CG10_big_fil_rev_8_21_14_0_10_32_14]